MKGKITLITPPDFYETDAVSLLFMHVNEDDQDKISKWLFDAEIDYNINIYFYDESTNISWLLYANARSDFKFIDLDNRPTNTVNLSGYLLGKNNIYWKTEDKNLAEIFHHINQNRIINIEQFLEKVFNGKDRT